MAQRTYYSEEARAQAKRDRNFAVTLAMLAGAGIGAILMFLFSPMSSSEARNQLESVVEDGKDHVVDGYEQVKEIAS